MRGSLLFVARDALSSRAVWTFPANPETPAADGHLRDET